MSDYLNSITAMEDDLGTRKSVEPKQKEMSTVETSAVPFLSVSTNKIDMELGTGSASEDAKYLIPKKVVARRYVLKK